MKKQNLASLILGACRKKLLSWRKLQRWNMCDLFAVAFCEVFQKSFVVGFANISAKKATNKTLRFVFVHLFFQHLFFLRKGFRERKFWYLQKFLFFVSCVKVFCVFRIFSQKCHRLLIFVNSTSLTSSFFFGFLIHHQAFFLFLLTFAYHKPFSFCLLHWDQANSQMLVL